MKATLLTTATCSMAAFGLAALPLYADNATATKPVIEAATVKTVSVYILQVSGKG
jgi:hypothetical protein